MAMADTFFSERWRRHPTMAGEERGSAALLRALQGLTPEDFQEFKAKLSELPVERGGNIPRDCLAKAAHPCALLSCMGSSYREDVAMDVAIGLFQEMNLRDLAERLLDEKVKEHKRRYREHVLREFLRYKEVSSCLGESVSLGSRYTALSTARRSRGHEEAAGTGHGRAGASQTLFGADGDGRRPRVVVLVGAPGMGKTMTVRKVMVEWAEGTLGALFDYVFCTDCKDVAPAAELSVAGLVSRCCPHRHTPAGNILRGHKKILFIFDGFEALGFPLARPQTELSSDPREAKPLEITLMSLLKKTALPECSLLITTRPAALQRLRQCLEGECYVEILGFSAASKQEYFHRHFGDASEADVAFGYVRGNEVLYSLCAIPAVSWTVCTVLQQELHKSRNLSECSKATTQMSMFYLSWLTKSRGRDKEQDLQKFLRELCSLAADGIWKHKVLFEEKEIKERGLDQPELLPLFLNEKISKAGAEEGNTYSFTHLHLQELFAALFYVLEDEEETGRDSGALAKDVNVLLESYSESRQDLRFTVRFLFGLMSQKAIEYADEVTGCGISPRAREGMLRWLQGRHGGISHPQRAQKLSHLDTCHFLFEMNEKSFTQSALGGLTDIDLRDVRFSLYDQAALCFCIRHWDGLDGVTLRGCSFAQGEPREQLPTALTRCSTPGAGGTEGTRGTGGRAGDLVESHPPIRPLCQALQQPGSRLRVLRLHWCGLSESCCRELGELLALHPGLARLELADGALGDGGVRLLCHGLLQPGCRLRALRACCRDLAAVLSTSPCLEELDLSFSEGLRDAGAGLLAEGLRRRGCRLRTLRLGSCRLTGACCRALAAGLLETPQLGCLDLSDNELGAEGVLQLCQQLRHPACPLRALGLSTSGLNEEALQALSALRELKPDLKIGNLLEQEVPEEGAMARLPFHRGVLPGTAGTRGRKVLPAFRRGPLL
ncbi:NACHT, LRR and PYD domains-containing protein 3 isoform X2 [Colius striatus]|uniref:NACHT, LRR and PYD domains-containing protein 3 isoform X2 n=1 Tax=Colius striatus TaxID=57412 RepID=UPI002B1D2502|nr:NACHT, LRR and PYD domains-containing protein 3 isoform X2 [Colius striatus]